MNVKTPQFGNRGKLKKKFIFSAPTDLPSNALKYSSRALNFPV